MGTGCQQNMLVEQAFGSSRVPGTRVKVSKEFQVKVPSKGSEEGSK